MKRIILKISGEALSGNDYKGINAEKVQETADFKSHADENDSGIY